MFDLFHFSLIHNCSTFFKIDLGQFTKIPNAVRRAFKLGSLETDSEMSIHIKVKY